MQRAAQIERAPANSRECGGHNGNRFVPVAIGGGRWTYYWLTTRQASFWRSRNEPEKAAIVQSRSQECLICRVQRAMETQALSEDRLYRALMLSLLENG